MRDFCDVMPLLRRALLGKQTIKPIVATHEGVSFVWGAMTYWIHARSLKAHEVWGDVDEAELIQADETIGGRALYSQTQRAQLMTALLRKSAKLYEARRSQNGSYPTNKPPRRGT